MKIVADFCRDFRGNKRSEFVDLIVRGIGETTKTMESFGQDVAQKIKSAIRAKLVELDAYVDDELPDYIMVMVANKKSKAAMTEDLSLFLNEHTEHFTDWLHGVLEKLHSVSLEGSRSRRRSSGSTSEVKSANVETVEQETVSTSQIVPIDEENTVVDVIDVKSKERTDSVYEPIIVPTAIDVPPADSEHQDDFLAIKAEQEKDEILGEELKEECVTPQVTVDSAEQAKSSPAIEIRQAEVTVTSSSITAENLPVPESSPTKSASSAGTRLIRTTRVSYSDSKESFSNGVAVQPKLSRRPERKAEALPIVRKRRIPSSTLGAVVQRQFPQPDDEEDDYDPRHPTIGTVASVVHVSQRKISVPPERQANKNLLLKAIDEARLSVLSSTKTAQATAHIGNEVTKQLFTKTYLSTLEQQQQQQQQERIVDNSSTKFRRRALQRLSHPVNSVSNETPVARSCQLGETDGPPEKKSAIESVALASPEPIGVASAEDQQLLDAAIEPMAESEDRGGRGVDEVEEYVEYSPEEPMELTIAPQEIVRPASPRFIITLDGVDADNMFPGYEKSTVDPTDDTLELLVDGELDFEVPKLLQQQQQQQQQQTTAQANSNGRNAIGSRIRGRVASLTDDEMEYEDDDEETENLTAATKRGKPEVTDRCRYWPSCRNGDDCPYRHPSELCKSFPNCKFGNHCVYIHPPCKYDAMCSRRDCRYEHTRQRLVSATPVVAPVTTRPRRRPFTRMTVEPQPFVKATSVPAAQRASNTPRCRDFPNCTNMNCRFLHPKMCRYGVGCIRADCIFSHPSLPKRDQLKWNNRLTSSTNHVSHREIPVIKLEP